MKPSAMPLLSCGANKSRQPSIRRGSVVTSPLRSESSSQGGSVRRCRGQRRSGVCVREMGGGEARVRWACIRGGAQRGVELKREQELKLPGRQGGRKARPPSHRYKPLPRTLRAFGPDTLFLS